MNIKKGKYKSAKKLIKQFLSRLDSQDLMENHALKGLYKYFQIHLSKSKLKPAKDTYYIYIYIFFLSSQNTYYIDRFLF